MFARATSRLGSVAADPLADERLTTLGLFIEAHAGLTRELERRLERDCGLPVQWFEVLLRLARTPGGQLRMTDLAAQTVLTPSGLTRVVDKLEAAGLVRRQSCASDRRGSFATLTAKGRRRVDVAVPVHLRHIEELLGSALGRAELDELAALLRRVRDAVNPDAAAASECPPLTRSRN
jgi:MarR family transcriptional regulator, 2-MHQ and catechol-resistance regulon repressor